MLLQVLKLIDFQSVLNVKLGYFTLRLLGLGGSEKSLCLSKQTAIVVSLETLVWNWVDEDVLLIRIFCKPFAILIL